MKEKIVVFIVIAIFLAAASPLSSQLAFGENDPITPEEYQKMLGVGMDVSWAQFKKEITKYNENMVKDYKKEGFSTIRIRVNDDVPAEEKIPIINRIVNDCLNNGLIPIIAFSAETFKENPTEENLENVVNWWGTIAEHFKDYPYLLSYDLIIETTGNINEHTDILNECYEKAVSRIREIDPYRIIFITPPNVSNPFYLPVLRIPSKANGYIMAEWHFYAGGPSKKNTSKLWTTGTPYEKLLILDKINAALTWQEHTGIRTWVGAWMPGNYNHGNNYSVSEQVNSQRLCPAH